MCWSFEYVQQLQNKSTVFLSKTAEILRETSVSCNILYLLCHMTQNGDGPVTSSLALGGSVQ